MTQSILTVRNVPLHDARSDAPEQNAPIEVRSGKGMENTEVIENSSPWTAEETYCLLRPRGGCTIQKPVKWVNDVAQSEQSQIQIGHMLKTAKIVNPKDRI